MPSGTYVVTALSNEAPYLLEWVAHYRGLGFDGAIVFTAHARDGTDAMAARLAELGHVHHVPMDLKEGRDPMRQAMRDLPEVARGIGATWCLAAHIDEYLSITAGEGTLPDLMAAMGQDVDAISVCRRAFGSSGQRGITQGQLRETHRLAATPEDRGRMVSRGIKTLFRVDRITRVAPHRPYFDEGTPPVTWVDAGGQAMPGAYLDGQWTAPDGFRHDHARLHYYAVPSPEALMIRAGVPGDKQKRKVFASDWRKLDVNTQADDSMARAVGLSDPLLAAMNSDDILSSLQAKGRAWHEAEAAALLQDDAIRVLCDELSGTKADSAPLVRTSPRGGAGLYVPPPIRPIRFDIAPSPDGETRAVLHGGFHKTATTYLQRLLEDNEAWLGGQSVYMVPHLKLRKHITFPSQLDAYRNLKIRRRTKFSEEELQGFTEAFFREPIARAPARMILSDENIPGLPAHCVTTGKLYEHRRMFFKCFAKRIPVPITDAFFAVRNYADFFASSYVEYLRAATTTTTGVMDTPEAMKRNVFAALPDWRKVFEDFMDVFPGVRLHVWRFEEFRDLTPQILSGLCGEGVDVSKLKPPKERNARPSASARAVEELVLISELQGAAAMAEHAKTVQDMYPQSADYERFDPWTAGERAHLTALYGRDWSALCEDDRIVTLKA